MARLRYRKSIRLPGGVRMNVSSKGIGYSWGVRGARITRRADGRTTFTGSLRGTGLSVQQTLGRSTPHPRTRATLSAPQNRTVMQVPDYWTGFVANLFIPGLGMAHIQAPGWALFYVAMAIFGAFFVHPVVYVLSALGSLIHYRLLYRKGEFAAVPIQVSGSASIQASPAAPVQPPTLHADQAVPESVSAGSTPAQPVAAQEPRPRRFQHGGLPPFVLTTGSSSLVVGVSLPAQFPDPGGEAEANFNLLAGVMHLGDRHMTSVSSVFTEPQGGKERFQRFVLASGGELSEQGFRIRDVTFRLEDHWVHIQSPPEYDILDQFPALAGDNVCLESIHQSGNGVLLTVAGWNNFHPNRRQGFLRKWTFLNIQVNGTVFCEFTGDLPASDFLQQHTRCILRTGGQIFPLYFAQQTHRQPQPDGPFEIWINTTHLSTTWTVLKFDRVTGLFGYSVSRPQPEWLP